MRLLLLIIAGLAIAACSTESYRDSADLQVGKLVRDRQKETLGYTPEAEVEKTIPTKPKKAAYARIPATPVTPPTTVPISFQKVEVPRVPDGPEVRWMDDTPIDAGTASAEALQKRLLGGPGFVGPPTAEALYRRYELFGLIEYAVQNSRQYRDQMESLYLSALDVTLQRHLLSPRPFVTQSFNWDGGQKDVGYRSALTAATSAGVRQKLPYGGEVVAETLVQFVDALSENVDSGESASLALSGSIPLMRGAGMVNLEGLISSERQLVYQVREFEQFRRDFVVTIASQYFNLLAQQQGVVNRRLSYANLTALTERTQELYDAGRLSFLEVQRSLQSQLFSQSGLIDAEERFQSAIDNFKVLIGMPVSDRLEIVPVELDVQIPRFEADDAIDMANRYRLDLRTAQDQIEDAQRGVQIARNGLLPDVNLTAGGKLTNEPGTPAGNIEDRTLTYNAGISIDLPIDRVAERNSLRRALISFQRQQREFSRQKDVVAVQVREALRSLRAAEASVEIQRRGIDLAQSRLEYSNLLLVQGKINARDIVESQASLLEAQDQYEQARSQLQIRVLQFMRDTGTLRVDPAAGAIGHAMDRAAREALDPLKPEAPKPG